VSQYKIQCVSVSVRRCSDVLYQAIGSDNFKQSGAVGIINLVNMNVEVTDDDERCFIRRNAFEQFVEVVEERRCDVDRTWPVDDDDYGVKSRSIHVGAKCLERTKRR
jgi:hypothetical protein